MLEADIAAADKAQKEGKDAAEAAAAAAASGSSVGGGGGMPTDAAKALAKATTKSKKAELSEQCMYVPARHNLS